MNERIRQLYDQAIIIEDGGDYVCGELDPEKFAELIVRECAELCNSVATQHDNNNETKAEVGAWDCRRTIKEHFGVEE
jgi:hypothetical protein